MICVLSCVAPVSVLRAQVTYNHDAPFMNQFTVAEVGMGYLQPQEYYQVTHNSYRFIAVATNKNSSGVKTGEHLEKQIGYSEKMDSALNDRLKVESLYLADRSVDISWQFEKGKVESKLALMKDNVEKITLLGGSSSDYQEWLERWNAINCGVQEIRDSYMPQGSRQQAYLEIYKDILNKNRELCTYLSQLRSMKQVRNILSFMDGAKAEPIRRNRVAVISAAARGRWKISLASAGGFSVEE